MIFKLHYWLLTAGASAAGILLGVFVETYTDASPVEIGSLFMIMPFLGLIFRPIICSNADRRQNHRETMIGGLLITALSYSPFIIIPLMGESFYGEHPRLSWYLLVIFKIFGDIASSGVQSIGDSMAMNYSRRIGTQFAVYRIWGTISWIIFGLIIGQINEIWFLPKYVPGFMILILCSILNMFIFWLWPEEYFVILTEEEIQRELELQVGNKDKGGFSMSRSLMPRNEVLAHMKEKIKSIFGMGSLKSSYENDLDSYKRNVIMSKMEAEFKTDSMPIKTSSLPVMSFIKDFKGQAEISRRMKKEEEKTEDKFKLIDKTTQLKTFLLLMRRDTRILGYCPIFILGGFHAMTTNFFFIHLNGVCNHNGFCNYSNLTGLLQATMALAETVVFIYIEKIQNILGRLNLAAIALGLMTLKTLIYATIFNQIDPYWSVLIELAYGIVYGIFLTQQVELGHMFANEVEYILPELQERDIVKSQDQVDGIKLSLSATMQAFMINADLGLGRGFGALIFGFFTHKYSFQTLCLVLSIIFGIACIITFAINFICYIGNIEVDLKKQTTTTTTTTSNVDKNENVIHQQEC